MLEKQKNLLFFYSNKYADNPLPIFNCLWEGSIYLATVFSLFNPYSLRRKNCFCPSWSSFLGLSSIFFCLCPPLHPAFAYGSRLESNYFIHARNHNYGIHKRSWQRRSCLCSQPLLPHAQNPEVNAHGKNSQFLSRK